MVTLEFLVAACLDPVQAALVLALVVAYRGPLPIVAAGGAGALITESVMALAAPGYVWGELLAPRLVAALLQAAVAVLAVWLVRTAAGRATAAPGAAPGAALGPAERLATDGGAVTLEGPLEGLEPRAVPRHAMPWQKQSHVSRRIP
jgi:hypothetical protein